MLNETLPFEFCKNAGVLDEMNELSNVEIPVSHNAHFSILRSVFIVSLAAVSSGV